MKNKILTVGSIAIDELHTPKGSQKNILGGSATFFSIAASKYNPINLIGIVGNDFPKEGWDLFRRYNINTDLVSRKDGQTFNWGGRYSDDYSIRETIYTNLGVFDNYSPTLPESLDTDYLYLGNIQPSLQLDVIKQVKNKKRVVSDTMNLWINLDKKGLWNVIKKSNIFLLNDEEAMELTDETDLEKIAEILLSSGPEIVIIKKGSKGAFLATNNTKINVPVYDKINLFDPTGAGDSFAGGLVGYFSKNGENNLREAMIHATVTASYTVSDFGVKGLISSSEKSFEDRCEYLKSKI